MEGARIAQTTFRRMQLARSVKMDNATKQDKFTPATNAKPALITSIQTSQNAFKTPVTKASRFS
jgi:hypothetical protein